MLEDYRALSKKRLGPFSGNWEKNTITKIIGFKVRFNYQVYQNMNQVTFNIEAQVHSRTSQTKYQIRSTVMMGCPCLRRFIHLLRALKWISTTSNDFAKLFLSDPVDSNKMPTYIKARKYKM